MSDTRVVDLGIAPEAVPPRRRSHISIVVLILAALSLVLLAPAATAMWSTLHHWGASTGRQGEAGRITVTKCSRRPLALTWTCEGTFRVDDAYNGERIARKVQVPNDFQRHSAGDLVGVDLIRHDRTAYYYLYTYAVEVLAAAVGVLFCIAGGLGIVLARRRRPERYATAIAALGILLVLPLVLHVVGLTHTTASINENGPLIPASTRSAAPG
jgi:hypothetical protein